MKKQYYLKDKKAQIYKEIHTVKPGELSPIICLYPRSSNLMWCYSRQLSQDHRYERALLEESETRLFVFNYHTGIEPYNIINYKNKWYRITRVDTTDDYNGDLFVYVKDYEKDAPAESSIKKYDPSKWK